jgi:hypothetical protein
MMEGLTQRVNLRCDWRDRILNRGDICHMLGLDRTKEQNKTSPACKHTHHSISGEMNKRREKEKTIICTKICNSTNPDQKHNMPRFRRFYTPRELKLKYHVSNNTAKKPKHTTFIHLE